MYQIAKTFEFAASHALEGLCEGHPCANVHGHTYVVDVILEGARLDDAGMLVDYRELGVLKDFIDKTLDHQHLNDVLDCNPTAENIARVLYVEFSSRVDHVAAVRVHESPKTYAEYRPSAVDFIEEA